MSKNFLSGVWVLKIGSSANFVAIRGTDFSQQVSLTTSRKASPPEQLINQREKCRDTVVFYWAAWNFLASNG